MLQLATDRSLSAVTGVVARKLYAARVKVVRADTHRNELKVAYTFFEHVIERGYRDSNPFEGIQPEGELSAGKEVLRVDDARKFLRYAWSEKSAESLAAMLILVMGMRAGELLERERQDVDQDGSVLIVARSKTRAGVRRLVIPDFLRARFAARVGGLKAGEKIFPFSRYALHYHVKRLCGAAGVPIVCPHGLRGSAATNALEMGGTLRQVQLAMGHENDRVTRDHYIAPGTVESAEARQRADLLGGNFLETPASDSFPTTETEDRNLN